MQFLYSALSSNELKALYILLPPAHLYTPTLSQLLNGAYNPDTRYKALYTTPSLYILLPQRLKIVAWVAF